MIRFPGILCLLAMLLCGCAAREVLDPLPGTVPAGVDLSGTWRIRTDRADQQEQIQAAIRGAEGFKGADFDAMVPTNRSKKRRRSKSGLVHVFLETGDLLKITQTPHALYVSFDRSIVEEFRFGENRMISVGEISAQRVAGWDGAILVVETLDKNSMKLSDRYQLIDGGKKMQRTITFRSKDLTEESFVQEFVRSE